MDWMSLSCLGYEIWNFNINRETVKTDTKNGSQKNQRSTQENLQQGHPHLDFEVKLTMQTSSTKTNGSEVIKVISFMPL